MTSELSAVAGVTSERVAPHIQQRFADALQARGYRADPAQQRAIDQLAGWLERWLRGRSSWLRAPTSGVYLWGGVGRGKSFVMDAFFAAAPVTSKRRVHFHAFLHEVQLRLQEIAGQPDPLRLIAAEIAGQSRLLCFDEFHVHDIGDFNVGRLATSIGEFVVKNAELDQYREGKYDGDFVIVEIRPSTYNANGRMVIEIRAHLGGMTLSNIDALSRDEARRLSPQEVDPIDEEAQAPVPATPPAKPKAKPRSPRDPLVDTTPFGSEPATVSAAASAEADDAALFGALWPLGETVKLDATVDRRVLRQQRDRLDKLGYEFAPLSQDWHLKAA
ncbi:ATPase [Stutzerimonas stutzeri]|nr:ATPase [Stutzerimonas stutzeri]